MNNSIPDWVVERVRLGETPASWRERVAVAEAELSARIAELDADDAAVLVRLPVAAVVAEVARRRGSRWRVPVVAGWTAAALACAALLLLLWRGAASGSGTTIATAPPQEVTRIKGEASLLVFRQRGRDAERLRSGDRASSGDRLQLGYAAASERFGVIASVDGRGVVTIHWPESGGRAARIAGRLTLPSSFELDDAPGFERFVMVLSADAFDTVMVERALAGVIDPEARLELPGSFEQSSITLYKDTAP